MILEFNDQVFPSEVNQLDDKGFPLKTKEVPDRAVPMAKPVISRLSNSKLSGFEEMKFNAFVNRAIDLSHPTKITIKTKD